MNRSLKLSMLVALALGSAPALALDLGQIQVKSALNRPLVAEIPLHADYPGEADQVQAALASAADFARAGISRSDLKVPLAFAVATNAGGQKVIRITSTEPVREPYLDFLMQVDWPKGKLLREYTVLLDPLSMAAAPPSPNAPAPVAAPAPAPAPAPAAAPTPAPAPAPAAASAVQDGRYGPVQHGDTLSEIALATQLSGVSYQQMLLALKAANPDAFFRDNINALKSGAILRIPTREQAQAETRAAAIAAVRRQNQAWNNANAAAPTMVANAGGGADAGAADAGGAPGNGDHLSLVPPSEGSGSRAGNGGGDSANVSQLRQDLARSKEALSSQRQQAAELQSRIADLEQLSAKNKRLLSLKNTEIAELQQKLAEARKQAGMAPPAGASTAGQTAAAAAPAATVALAAATPASAAIAASIGAPAMAGASSSAMASASTVGASATDAGALASRPAAPEATPPAAAPTPAPVRTPTVAAPWYEQLWVRIAGGVIIVLLIAWALLRRRRAKPEAATSSLADQFGDSPFGHDRDSADDGLVEDDQSELLAQLAEHPDDIGLHLELVSVYYAQHDADRFEAAAEAMYAHVADPSQPEWQSVCAMGRDLAPDHPLFADATVMRAPQDAAEPSAPDDFAAASYESGDDDVSIAADEAVDDLPQDDKAAGDDGYNFDFNLTPPAPADGGPVPDMPAEEEFDALPPLPPEHEEGADAIGITPADDDDLTETGAGYDAGDFSDDPVDTKLDLARAYMDMGDPEGARAMLREAMAEGTQIQKDTAQKLLDEME